MSRRPALAVAVSALAAGLLLPAVAAAEPSAYRVETTLAPGAQVALQVGRFPRIGEFRFRLRVSSDDEKRFTLTQRRIGGTAFTVIDASSGVVPEACQGAAGSVFCTGITTPETPAGSRWRFVLRNLGARPATVDLRISWRAVNAE